MTSALYLKNGTIWLQDAVHLDANPKFFLMTEIIYAKNPNRR